MAFNSPHNLYAQALARAPISLRDYRIAAVIPAFNEEANIARVLRSLPAWLRHATRRGQTVPRCTIVTTTLLVDLEHG